VTLGCAWLCRATFSPQGLPCLFPCVVKPRSPSLIDSVDIYSWKLVEALCASSSGQAGWQPARRILHAAAAAIDHAEEDEQGQISPEILPVDAFFAPKSSTGKDGWTSSRHITADVGPSGENEEREGIEEGAGFRKGNWSPRRPSIREARDARLVSRLAVAQEVARCGNEHEAVEVAHQLMLKKQGDAELQEKEASARARALGEHDKRRREAEEVLARAKEDDKTKRVMEIASARARARDELARKEAEGIAEECVGNMLDLP
jgi:hypothetical protein